jgi:hypothetical protein
MHGGSCLEIGVNLGESWSLIARQGLILISASAHKSSIAFSRDVEWTYDASDASAPNNAAPQWWEARHASPHANLGDVGLIEAGMGP